MSGLAGWISNTIDLTKQEHVLSKMSLTLKNRGPDDCGQTVESNAALLHRRLCVIDPKTAIQPMTKTSKGEKYTLVYNGELYNMQELSAELKSLGYKFIGYSDTEALLYAYIQWGENCLNKLNGMFAFAVWEHNNKRLFLARDRLGAKPLFYYLYDSAKYGKGIIFASEIKTLLKNPLVEKVVDLEGLRQIFLLGPGKKSGSGIIKNIQELKPAHYMIFQEGEYKINQYWKLQAAPHENNLFMTIEKTRWLMLDSIKRQMVADAPLGCFLSGGLDSGIISAVAAAMFLSKGQRLVTFSVDYKDNELFFEKNAYQPDSDQKYISQMSAFIKSVHNYITLDNEQLGKALKEATDARDAPGMADIDSSLLLFCKIIKQKQIKVCLSGECADEIFGGYPWYHDQNQDINTFPWSKSLDIRTKLLRSAAVLKDAEQWVRQCFLDTINRTDTLPQDNPQERQMRQMFMLNIEWFMQTLLERKDRMSMCAGLEARVPFCDHRLVEYAYNMPWKYKAYNGREKGILREAVKDILPYDIIKRKKSPYPKTFSPIYLNYVKQQVKEIINNPNKIINELIDKEYVQSLLKTEGDFDRTFYGQLMRLPQLLGYIIQIDYFFESKKLDIVL
ncbi:MAG TPA: asparagine synthase (glutamine-hydrolyzing) [Clostridiales bacterium]|jgi:asparagine synthase (glutamine-hydrolysing)|nr:asparagine synthase (glutamine-hydrolyzing) [Clostridiales bacterium]